MSATSKNHCDVNVFISVSALCFKLGLPSFVSHMKADFLSGFPEISSKDGN